MEDDGKELVVQCCVCLECFDEEGDKRPVIRICGHSCCVGCSKKITAAPSNKCPVCNAVVTPKKGKEKVVINYQLIEQIRNQKEMVRRLAKMEKEHLENECQVNELKTKVSQAEEYEKFFKCLECKFPMKDGFFCLTCIRATVDAVEDYSDEELTEFISKVICGGCLKKHEKKEHETAELDEIKKKQHKKKFRKTLKEKIDKITSDFDLIKNVLGTVDGKMQRMLDAVAGAAISLPFDQTVSMLRMEREVIDNLNTFGSSLNLLVSESYHLQQHVEGVTQSSDSLASIPPAPPMTGAIKEECRDDYGSALGAMYASPPMPSPMSISAPRPSPEPQTPTTSFKRKKDGPSGAKRPRLLAGRTACHRPQHSFWSPRLCHVVFVFNKSPRIVVACPFRSPPPATGSPIQKTSGEGQLPSQPTSRFQETVVVEIDELATSTNVIAINSKSGVTGSYFQGDISLTPEQETEIEQGARRNKRQAISLARKWTNNTLNYYFDNGLEEKKKDAVKKALAYLQSYTCIDFHENSTAFDRVKVINGSGCSSFVGMIGGEQLLSLGTNCDHFGTAAHEFMHALGMEHTHDRFDRDNFILINTGAVNLLYLLSFLIIDPFRMVALVPYDYGSALHYPANAFTSGKNMSIVSKDTNYTYTMGSGLVSFYDLVAINTFYKCHEQFCAQSTTKCLNGGMPNPRDCSVCYCPSGYGGAICGEMPSGCGEALTATTEWQTAIMTLGTEGDNTFQNNYVYCNYWIQAPAGKRIESRIRSMKSPVCSYGCFFNGLELKLDVNTQPTGARFCCNEFVNRTLTSEQNPMPVIHYNSYSQSQFVLEYRYVDAPCREDHPLCESTPDFCTEEAYPAHYRRFYCPKKCQLC